MVVEAFVGAVAAAAVAGGIAVWRACSQRAFWQRKIQVDSVDAVAATHHHVSANLCVRNDAEMRATTAGALVDFESGEQRSADAPVAPQTGSKFSPILEPGKNQVFVKWKRADQDTKVSRLRLRVEGHLIAVPQETVDAINDEIAKRPRV